MKTIVNKQTEIKAPEDKMMSYFDLIKLIINAPSQEGYNVEQMRQRLEILRVIDDAEGVTSVSFELKDFNTLKDSVNKFKWAQIHKDIVAFTDYINSL
jgi:hypothetical protein